MATHPSVKNRIIRVICEARGGSVPHTQISEVRGGVQSVLFLPDTGLERVEQGSNPRILNCPMSRIGAGGAGFHGVGFSQGGLFLRGLAQRCGDLNVRSLVSIGGPQQGR